MNNHYPDVSIIIPIRNEAAYIERRIRLIAIQDYPLDHIEILIADGMSVDNTHHELTP